MVLLSVFAALGLALAVVGVYGVMAHTVAQQTPRDWRAHRTWHDPGSIRHMIVRSSEHPAVMAVGYGLVGSVFGHGCLARQISNVSPLDPISFATTSIVLITTSGCALRVARVACQPQPIVALQQE